MGTPDSTCFPQYPLEIVDKAGINLAEMRGEIKKTIAKHGRIGCVIVDYLQLMTDPTSTKRYEVVTAISMGLKRIAKDFKCPVIALSQLTKEALGRPLTMSDLRESGQIAQDADQIIFLYPDSKDMGVINANVAKNRHGKTGVARLLDGFEYCQFEAFSDQMTQYGRWGVKEFSASISGTPSLIQTDLGLEILQGLQ